MNTSVIFKYAVIALSSMPLLACDESPSAGVQPLGPSVALATWIPGPNDTCTRADHDRYTTVGPDSLLYPTWHPPTDPVTGCSFGHEHGRDPRGSALYRDVGEIPFGYANQRLDIYDPGMRRHEDHVGHKVEWENNVQLHFDGGGNAVLDVRCDVLTKLHQ